MSENYHKFIDAKGLTCPEPVMMLHAAVRDITNGDLVKVEATDPSTLRDIPNFCDFLGHQLVAQNEKEGEEKLFTFVIKKGG